jgi:hypothetical protein
MNPTSPHFAEALDGSSIWSDPDRSCRIVWMIKRMIKRVGRCNVPSWRIIEDPIGRAVHEYTPRQGARPHRRSARHYGV